MYLNNATIADNVYDILLLLKAKKNFKICETICVNWAQKIEQYTE